MGIKKIELNAVRNNVNGFMEFIESYLETLPIDPQIIPSIMISCEEIIVNVVNYAYQNKEGNLSIEIETTSKEIKIVFSDSGIPFNPLEIKEVDTSLPLQEREIGGLGIHMVKKLMDDVKYEYKENKNCLTIVKQILTE